MKLVDIITHTDEQTREVDAWAVTRPDGSCLWFESLEEAEDYYEGGEQ